MQTYTYTIAARFDSETRDMINNIAETEDRKPGAVVRMLVKDGLKLRGLVASEHRTVEANTYSQKTAQKSR